MANETPKHPDCVGERQRVKEEERGREVVGEVEKVAG